MDSATSKTPSCKKFKRFTDSPAPMCRYELWALHLKQFCSEKLLIWHCHCVWWTPLDVTNRLQNVERREIHFVAMCNAMEFKKKCRCEISILEVQQQSRDLELHAFHSKRNPLSTDIPFKTRKSAGMFQWRKNIANSYQEMAERLNFSSIFPVHIRHCTMECIAINFLSPPYCFCLIKIQLSIAPNKASA